MIENPYQPPAEGSLSEEGHESYRTAALYGAKRGALYVGGSFLLLWLFLMGVYIYIWFTNPRGAIALLEGRGLLRELIDALGSILMFGTIGALCGAAWCAAREWGRRRRRSSNRFGEAEPAAR
jgi:hypothetical protein